MDVTDKNYFEDEKRKLTAQLRFVECCDTFTKTFDSEKEINEEEVERAINDFTNITKAIENDIRMNDDNDKILEYLENRKNLNELVDNVKSNMIRRKRYDEFEAKKQDLLIYKNREHLLEKLQKFDEFTEKLFTEYEDTENLKAVKGLIEAVRDDLENQT